MARGSMNNCWVLPEQLSFQFKIIVNWARNAKAFFKKQTK